MALLLQMADAMFPEGQGAPRAMAKVDAAAEESNELLVNAKEAVDELWRQRGLDPKKPELTMSEDVEARLEAEAPFRKEVEAFAKEVNAEFQGLYKLMSDVMSPALAKKVQDAIDFLS